MGPRFLHAAWKAMLAWACAATASFAQDLEPRRWTHMPEGTDVVGVGYLFSTGDLAFDPVLRIDDAEVQMHTALLSYSRYFDLAGRTARIDAVVPFQSGRWDGLLDGVPREVERDGMGDPALRLSVSLAGAPALSSAEFAAFRGENPIRTTVGAALEVRLPLGEYQEDKLINLGQNRFVFATQLGVLHTRGEWSYELTGTLFLYGENDEFFNGNRLEQDPLYAVQAHVVRTFGPNWWVSAGAAYGWEGESEVNDVAKDDEKSTLLYGASFGFRVGASQAVRLAYARTDTLVDIGADTDSFYVGWSIRL